jgi:peroxiredoxin family protein
MELLDTCPWKDSAEGRTGSLPRAGKRIVSVVDTVVNFIGAVRPAAHLRSLLVGAVAVGLAVACYVAFEGRTPLEADEAMPQWTAVTQVDTANLTTVGKNAYFNLEPGYRLQYTDGSRTRTMTVRRTTKIVDGVETRVIEEKEAKDGQPTKVVWKYYAIDKTTTALYCFGVHVQSYQNGQLVSHRGWRAGDHGALFTLAMFAEPKPGDTLVREHAKRVDKVVDTHVKVVTPAGTFTNCLRTRAKGAAENEAKVFAPGVGLVKDGQFTLVKISQALPRNTVEVSTD